MVVTNIYIDSVLYRLLPKQYQGCWSSNNAPKLKDKGSVIINFSPEKKPGTHFIAFYRRNDKLCYIDSLSTPLDMIPSDISKWIGKQDCSSTSVYYKKKIQDTRSDFCGFYCINAVLERSLGLKPKRYNISTGNLLHNDEKCLNNILKIIKAL